MRTSETIKQTRAEVGGRINYFCPEQVKEEQRANLLAHMSNGIPQ